MAINAFDDPIIDGASLPLDEFHASSHVYTAISGGGGHLGWFEGSRANTRWSLKPVAEWFEAATRDFRVEGKRVDLEKGVDGWVWGEEMAHEVSGIGEKEGGGGGRLGWKVLDRGEVVEGAEGEGPLQGL